MITRQEVIERLAVSLTDSIDNWMENVMPETAGVEEMGWFGDSAARLMAKAAIAVLESSADVQDYLMREGQLKRD